MAQTGRAPTAGPAIRGTGRLFVLPDLPRSLSPYATDTSPVDPASPRSAGLRICDRQAHDGGGVVLLLWLGVLEDLDPRMTLDSGPFHRRVGFRAVQECFRLRQTGELAQQCSPAANIAWIMAGWITKSDDCPTVLVLSSVTFVPSSDRVLIDWAERLTCNALIRLDIASKQWVDPMQALATPECRRSAGAGRACRRGSSAPRSCRRQCEQCGLPRSRIAFHSRVLP